MEAGLPENAIRTVLAGHEPKVGRLAEICDALGLELYVGPPRDTAAPADTPAAPADAPKGRPLHQRLALLATPSPADLAHTIQRIAWDAVRLAWGLGRDPIPDDLWPVLAAQRGDGLAPPINQNLPASAQPVDVIELEAAAGGGAEAAEEASKGRVWFRRSWLRRRGLDPVHCAVIGVRGKSMEPTLPNGCSILLDRKSTEWQPPRIFVVRTEAGLVVKRAAESESGERIMASDHPAWPDAPWPEVAEIVGRVRWMARGL